MNAYTRNVDSDMSQSMQTCIQRKYALGICFEKVYILEKMWTELGLYIFLFYGNSGGIKMSVGS